jgi:hypothetical protein
MEGGGFSMLYYNIIATLKNCLFSANQAKKGSGFFLLLENYIENII